MMVTWPRMRLLLIRHARTDGNDATYVGREDLPLNADGRAEAAALADVLGPERIVQILTSPLSRAVDTALAIAGPRGLSIERHDGLVEIDYGQLSGTTKGERQFQLRKQYIDHAMPGGESLSHVWDRLSPVADLIRTGLLAGQPVAVVGHYWSNRLLLGRLAGSTIEKTIKDKRYRPTPASSLAVDYVSDESGVREVGRMWLLRPADRLTTPRLASPATPTQ